MMIHIVIDAIFINAAENASSSVGILPTSEYEVEKYTGLHIRFAQVIVLCILYVLTYLLIIDLHSHFLRYFFFSTFFLFPDRNSMPRMSALNVFFIISGTERWLMRLLKDRLANVRLTFRLLGFLMRLVGFGCNWSFVYFILVVSIRWLIGRTIGKY